MKPDLVAFDVSAFGQPGAGLFQEGVLVTGEVTLRGS